MRQVTGSNTPAHATKVSIQLALDGHSFSVCDLSCGEVPDDAPLTVEVLTPRTLLVPAELFDAERAAELLRVTGLAPKSGECVVCSDLQAGVAAVVAVPEEALRQLQERWGKSFRFTTPLLADPPKTDAAIRLCRKADLLYIKVYREKILRFAEVVPAPADADILYLLDRLAAEFPLNEFGLYLAGDGTRNLQKLLDGIFKEVICE